MSQVAATQDYHLAQPQAPCPPSPSTQARLLSPSPAIVKGEATMLNAKDIAKTAILSEETSPPLPTRKRFRDEPSSVEEDIEAAKGSPAPARRRLVLSAAPIVSLSLFQPRVRKQVPSLLQFLNNREGKKDDKEGKKKEVPAKVRSHLGSAVMRKIGIATTMLNLKEELPQYKDRVIIGTVNWKIGGLSITKMALMAFAPDKADKLELMLCSEGGVIPWMVRDVKLRFLKNLRAVNRTLGRTELWRRLTTDVCFAKNMRL